MLFYFFWWSSLLVRSVLTTFPITATRLTALFSKRQIEQKFPIMLCEWGDRLKPHYYAWVWLWQLNRKHYDLFFFLNAVAEGWICALEIRHSFAEHKRRCWAECEWNHLCVSCVLYCTSKSTLKLKPVSTESLGLQKTSSKVRESRALLFWWSSTQMK